MIDRFVVSFTIYSFWYAIFGKITLLLLAEFIEFLIFNYVVVLNKKIGMFPWLYEIVNV